MHEILWYVTACLVLSWFIQGLPTLEAKNAEGLKPVDIAVDSKMREFLETAELNIRNNMADMIIENNHVEGCSLDGVQRKKDPAVLRPSEDAYQGALGRKGRHANGHVPPQKCEAFLLVLSHLVQCYARLSAAGSVQKQSRQFKDFAKHVSNLEIHIQRIIAQDNITPLCSMRLLTMKLLDSNWHSLPPPHLQKKSISYPADVNLIEPEAWSLSSDKTWRYGRLN